MARTLRIGLTGALGSGKSAVARFFEEFGSRVIDADAIAREVVAPGSEALAEISEAFGSEMIGEDGALDRGRMARRVFNDAQALARLEAIVHPRVRRREMALLRRFEQEGAAMVVFDVPLLFEKGLDEIMDCVVAVTADEAVRKERLARDRSLSAEEVDRRSGAQLPASEKAARADHQVNNNGGLENTRRQVRELVEMIRREPESSEAEDV